MNLSVVVPLLNESDSLNELFQRIKKVCDTHQYSFEVIFVDDGSTDDSWQVIQDLQQSNPEIKGIKFQRNYGKSQALHAAFEKVIGDVVITMDADLQDFPEEIPELYNAIVVGGNDLVSGWKKKRYDHVITKNIPSKLFNWAAQKTSKVTLHDFNCGLKAYKKEVVKSIDVHGDMHRYIPVLAKNAGFDKITEKPVQHQARKYGKSKFGANRFTRGFLDLITLWFISRFAVRPMHFFGLMGTLIFIFGFFTAFFVGAYKLYKVYCLNLSGDLVAENPWFYIALTAMILGSQFFIAGFLGEILIRNRRNNQDYIISDQV